MSRTQEQILSRIDEVADGDFFGFAREVLVEALDYEHAEPWLREGVTSAEWDASRTVHTEQAARNYLTFAIGKILGHRGISAGRSVEKLRQFAWLLDRDDVVDAMDAADYPQYGAPQVKAFADVMGWPFEVGMHHEGTDGELQRMAAGQPCYDGCDSGCRS